MTDLRTMPPQVAEHVRLLLRVHEHRATAERHAADTTLPHRIRDAAAKLAGDDA